MAAAEVVAEAASTASSETAASPEQPPRAQDVKYVPWKDESQMSLVKLLAPAIAIAQHCCR